MNSAIRWMAENHVAANLLMLVLIVGGVIMGFSIKQEVFPDITLDRIQVSVAYPGAGPEEVEEGVIFKIEENLTGVDGIKQVKSVAAEGYGSVIAEVTTDADIDLVLQDIKSEVDRITTFPKDAEQPVVSKILNRREVISVVVFGALPERSLRELAEQVRDELLLESGITQVDLSGVRPYEISVEISEDNLRRYGLTFDQVAQRIRQASLDLPGGTIKADSGEVLIRTKERRYVGHEYASIVVLTTADGTEVSLGDIATFRMVLRKPISSDSLMANLQPWPRFIESVIRSPRKYPIRLKSLSRPSAGNFPNRSTLRPGTITPSFSKAVRTCWSGML